jgi:hypothetical protein
LTRYRTWKGPQGETLDGTNNACERAIDWWIKERYRTMRGYKVPENAVRVSRLLAWCGNFLTAEGGANLPALLRVKQALLRDPHGLFFPTLLVPTIERSPRQIFSICKTVQRPAWSFCSGSLEAACI